MSTPLILKSSPDRVLIHCLNSEVRPKQTVVSDVTENGKSVEGCHHPLNLHMKVTSGTKMSPCRTNPNFVCTRSEALWSHPQSRDPVWVVYYW